jgi:ABC-type oligopeptide transport system substrate-binding subunit
VPVTAGDFEYAWKRVLDPATRSRNASLLYDVAGARAFHQGEGTVEDVGVRAADEETLIVQLEGPAGYFFQLLAYGVTYPVPRHVVEAHGEAWSEAGEIVTNGPFRLASWRQDESIALTRNPEYHGRFRGNVDQVELALIAEGEWSTQLERYEAAGLDVLDVLSFPAPEHDRARQRHPGEYILGPLLSTTYIGFDVSRPPFDDARVRRAFALATDREWLADVVMGGDESPATGGFVPAGMPGHSTGIGLPHDPEQAQALLAKAGYPGGRGFPAVDAVSISGGEAYGDYPEAWWREHLGLEIHWEILDWTSFLPRLEGDPPHLFGMGWVADYPDPDNFLRVSLFRRYTRWRNPTYDGLVERARRSTVQAERMELYAQADRILVEEAVVLPLTYQRRHLLVKPWVSRYPTSAMRTLFWKDVVIEPH